MFPSIYAVAKIKTVCINGEDIKAMQIVNSITNIVINAINSCIKKICRNLPKCLKDCLNTLITLNMADILFSFMYSNVADFSRNIPVKIRERILIMNSTMDIITIGENDMSLCFIPNSIKNSMKDRIIIIVAGSEYTKDMSNLTNPKRIVFHISVCSGKSNFPATIFLIFFN